MRGAEGDGGAPDLLLRLLLLLLLLSGGGCLLPAGAYSQPHKSWGSRGEKSWGSYDMI